MGEAELARRIDAPEESTRDWEQGKHRPPRSAARYLQEVFGRDPRTTSETALPALPAIITASLG